MKMKKLIIGYRKGYKDGYDDGYDYGISKGRLEGYQKGKKFKEQEEYYNASCRYGEQICPQCNSHFILRAEPMRFCYKCGSRLSEVEE